jgi:predicted RNA-binding Zn-ribbon protein involved in translation (DUF1610 family)
VFRIIELIILFFLLHYFTQFLNRYEIFRKIIILKSLAIVIAGVLIVVLCTLIERAWFDNDVPPDKSSAIVNEFGEGGLFHIDMSRGEVVHTINMLGRSGDKYEEFENTDDGSDKNEINRIYRSMYFVFAFDRNDMLSYIATNQNVYSTALGLTSGDSLKRMKELYGEDFMKYTDSDVEVYSYQTDGNYLYVYAQNNKVVWWGLSRENIEGIERIRALDFIEQPSTHKIQRNYYSLPGYKNKPHYCPECGALMYLQVIERVVSSKSPEARNFDFSFGESGNMTGTYKFIWDEFYCPQCGNQLTISEMQEYEKQK